MKFEVGFLGEICEFENGDRGKNYPSKDSFQTQGVPFINAGNIKDYILDIGSFNYISKERFNLLSNGKVIKGDILFCLRGSIGKFAKVENITEGAIASSLVILRPKENVDLDYLRFYLRSSLCQAEINSFKNGAAQPNLSARDLKKFQVPLPPLPIQKQIAAVLEKADNLRQQSQRMEQELNSLTQSVFLDMFGDPATNEKGWPIATIGDCCKSVNYGTSEKADESTGDYPVLRMNNITYNGRWNFDSLKYINLDDKGTEKYLVESGDLLFNRTNSKELVGKTAVFRENKAMAFAGYLVRARLNERAVPEYISAVMNSRYGKQTLLSMCKSIVGMANINAKEFQKIRIPIPPIALQVDFQEIILSINSKMKDIEVNKKEYQNLFNSLMQRAFKGELDLKDVA